MKLVLVVLSALLLSGCGVLSRGWAKIVGLDKTCVEGVSYLQFSSGASVQYDREGKVVLCQE